MQAVHKGLVGLYSNQVSDHRTESFMYRLCIGLNMANNTPYTPTPETRRDLIGQYVHSLTTDSTPLEDLSHMCWMAVKRDFAGSVTTEQNKAVMTFMVAFFANLTTQTRTTLLAELSPQARARLMPSPNEY